MFDYLAALLNPDFSDRYSDVRSIINVFVNLALGTGAALSVIGIVYSGIQIAMSKGDFKAVAKAKQALTYSIIGFILAIGAFAIKDFVLDLFGASIPDEPPF